MLLVDEVWAILHQTCLCGVGSVGRCPILLEDPISTRMLLCASWIKNHVTSELRSSSTPCSHWSRVDEFQLSTRTAHSSPNHNFRWIFSPADFQVCRIHICMTSSTTWSFWWFSLLVGSTVNNFSSEKRIVEVSDSVKRYRRENGQRTR